MTTPAKKPRRLGGKFKIGQEVHPSKSSLSTMTITDFERVTEWGRKVTYAVGVNKEDQTMRRPLSTLISLEDAQALRNSKPKTLFEKDYDYESLYDLNRDLAEANDEEFNPVMADLPKDEFGFIKGTFTVKIEWKDED